jgi:hypothetical protein
MSTTYRLHIKPPIRLLQWARKKGLCKLYGHSDRMEAKVAIFGHRFYLDFCGPRDKEPKRRTAVWDLDRKMWWHKVYGPLGYWRLWHRGRVRIKWGIARPGNVMTGPHITTA